VKRVLLTGASGLIGRHAGSALVERGYEVHAVARHPPPGRDGHLNWHAVDLFDLRATEDLVAKLVPTHLLHLAWDTEPGVYLTSDVNERWREVSAALLEAFGRHAGRRAVLAGTCFEYDWSAASEPLTEGAPLRPRSPYGVAKDALRRDAEGVAADADLSLAWGRVFFLFGPGEHPRRLVASIAQRLLAGEPAPCSDGRQVRDFLFSAEVARAFVALLDSPTRGPVNIASGTGVAVRHLAELVGSAAGRPDLLQFGALPRAPDDPPRVVGDATRLREDIGWRPVVTLSEAVARTVTSWRCPGAEASRSPTPG
jgi:nucleoside-diphosphate-sugar epimerase